MTIAPNLTRCPGSVVYQLIIEAKPANLVTRKQLIADLLNVEGEAFDQRKEVVHFLYSPMIRFNVKPKKDWIVGTDVPTATWPEARELLLKLSSREITGNAAKEAAEAMMASLSTDYADLFKRCLEKRPDAGMGATIINKELPRYIPQFKCSLATPFELQRCQWPMIVQPKLDGVRTLAHVDFQSSVVKHYSREGLTFTSNAHLDADLLTLGQAIAEHHGFTGGIVLDGEVYGENFKETISATRKKDGSCATTKFHIYDFVPAADFFDQVSHVIQQERSRAIQTVFETVTLDSVQCVPSRVARSVEDAAKAYEAFRSAGYEGAVLKAPKSTYQFKRGFHWIKMKPEETLDLVITGWEEGTGKYVGQIGALVVDYAGVSVSVGSGLTDALRLSLWAERDELAGRLIEVNYMEETPDKSLRHPVFVAFRDLPEAPGVKV